MAVPMMVMVPRVVLRLLALLLQESARHLRRHTLHGALLDFLSALLGPTPPMAMMVVVVVAVPVVPVAVPMMMMAPRVVLRLLALLLQESARQLRRHTLHGDLCHLLGVLLGPMRPMAMMVVVAVPVVPMAVPMMVMVPRVVLRLLALLLQECA